MKSPDSVARSRPPAVVLGRALHHPIIEALNPVLIAMILINVATNHGLAAAKRDKKQKKAAATFVAAAFVEKNPAIPTFAVLVLSSAQKA